MSKNRLREELTLIEGLLSEYYEDQRKLAEKLRERLYREGE
jgi:translation initiation factor 1 (eIF-1/SUI1)